jgi:cytochrome d ubiquinol oxidase subunit II
MAEFLPVFFVMAMGLALLLYVILDGFDLGVGLLLPLATDAEKDTMIASIGPFWDANETWIVLGIGILLIAFPKAHGLILSALYIPVTLMLFGLILRGVAFDFRVKAGDARKQLWNRAFFVGSLTASMSQGWMLGSYITGLESTPISLAFAALIALTLPALYIMLGAGWLLIKTEHELFDKAVRWARLALPVMGLALLLVSIATPIVSADIAQRWFTLPNAIGLLPIPVSCMVAYFVLHRVLRRPEYLRTGTSRVVYGVLVLICLMAALGLAYSIYPDIVMGKMDLFEAAAATNSLQFIFYGVAVTLPVIFFYSAYVFWVFRGKATNLSYE